MILDHLYTQLTGISNHKAHLVEILARGNRVGVGALLPCRRVLLLRKPSEDLVAAGRIRDHMASRPWLRKLEHRLGAITVRHLLKA